MALVRRTPNPEQPWALIWKEQFGVTKIIRAHVANLPWLCREYGWHVLITDLDVPLSLPLGQEWHQQTQAAVKKTPFYPMRPPDDNGSNDPGD